MVKYITLKVGVDNYVHGKVELEKIIMRKAQQGILALFKVGSTFNIHGLIFLLLFITVFSSCKKHKTKDEEGIDLNPDKPPVTPPASAADNFMIVVIPDTQYYIYPTNGGDLSMFQAQIDWIKNNRVDSNIVYVVGVGDIVEKYDRDATLPQWKTASTVYSGLENVSGLPEGIPYGLALGNHDQTRDYVTHVPDTFYTFKYYNKFFGYDRFKDKSYYGGRRVGKDLNNLDIPNDNTNHYDVFTAGGVDFIVIYLKWDEGDYLKEATKANQWAYDVMASHPNHKAIVVSHYVVSSRFETADNQYEFGAQAQNIYDKLKTQPNFFMMLGGHVGGEGERQDTRLGKTVKSFTTDYQSETNGGNGYMRLMKFSIANDRVSFKTYSPSLKQYRTPPEYPRSEFIRPLFRNFTTSRTNDFNNSGKSALAFYDNGVWKVSGLPNVTYGTAESIPIPADYNGDGKTDYALYTSPNKWLISYTAIPILYGISGDIPVPGDYDGNGTTDVAVYRPSTNTWYVKGQDIGVEFGATGNIPLPYDFEGDGKVNIAVYDPSNSNWLIKDSGAPINFGVSGDVPVPGDYINSSGSASGDGIIDIAVFRPSNNGWYVKGRASNPVIIAGMGAHQSGDIPAPGDYNGDGKTDMAVYRTSTKKLHIDDGSIVTFGSTGDKLLNLPYHIRKFYYP